MLTTFIRNLHTTISGMILKGSQLDIELTSIPENLDVTSVDEVVNAIGSDISRLILLRQIKIKIGNQIKAETDKAAESSIKDLVAAGILRFNAETGKYEAV